MGDRVRSITTAECCWEVGHMEEWCSVSVGCQCIQLCAVVKRIGEKCVPLFSCSCYAACCPYSIDHTLHRATAPRLCVA